VHLWDRHGRGDSEGVPDPRRDPVGPDGDALVAAEVADLAAVTAAAGGVPLHDGHSAGAVLVLERCSGRGPSPWPRRSRTTSPSSPATRCRPTGSRAAAVPGARRRTLPGQGHLVTPAVLAPVLADFPDRVSRRGGPRECRRRPVAFERVFVGAVGRVVR
jgi:hypothetical protein